MNLTEIRNKCKQITDFDASLPNYNEQLDGFINDAFNALWTEKRWTFASQLKYLDIYQDIVPLQPDGVLTIGAICVFNTRRIQFVSSVYSLDIPWVWEGQVFEIQGRDYTILKVVSPTEIHLEEPFMGTTNNADLTWKLKHRFYDVPSEAIELLNLSHRDAPTPGVHPQFGKVAGLTARTEEEVNLREDLTCTWSECYINTPPVVIPAAEKLTVVRYPNADGTPGDIVAGTKLELCWAFEGKGGKIGPLSQPVIFTQPPQTAGGPVLPDAALITFKTFDDITIAAPVFNAGEDQIVNQWEGLRKRIFFNQNFNRTTGVRLSGLPVWREVTIGSTVVIPGIPGVNTAQDAVKVSDESGTYILSYLDQVGPGNKRYLDWDGHHDRIRPYPRPVGRDALYAHTVGQGGVVHQNGSAEREFRQWECRFYKKPQQLGLQTDTPEMPHEFHQVIVYRTLMDIYSKHDNLQQKDNYEARYKKEIARLEKRYVDKTDVVLVRGQFGLSFNGWSRYDINSLRKTN